MFQVSDALNLTFQVEHPTNVYYLYHQWRRALTPMAFGEVASTAKWQKQSTQEALGIRGARTEPIGNL